MTAKIEGYDRLITEAAEAEKRGGQNIAGPASPATTDTVGTVDSLVAQLTEQRKAFTGDPTTESYTRLAESCERLLRPLRETPAVAGQFSDATCRSDNVSRLVQARPEIVKAQADFNDRCASEKVSVLIREAAAVASGGKGKEGLERAQRTIESCIDLASRARVQTDDLQKRVSGFIEANSPERDEFAKTLGAFKLAPTQAWIAAFASFIQDLVIFFFTLLSEMLKHDRRPAARFVNLQPVSVGVRSDDPGAVASARAILRLIAHAKGRHDRVDPNGPAWNALAPELKDNVLAQLKSLGRQNHAQRDRRGAWILDSGAVQELERVVHDYEVTTPPQNRPPEQQGAGREETSNRARDISSGDNLARARTNTPEDSTLVRAETSGNVIPIPTPPRPSRVQEILDQEAGKRDREAGKNVFPNLHHRARQLDEGEL